MGQNPPSRFYLVVLVVGGRKEGVEELSQMAKSGSDISSFGVSKKERERERERDRERQSKA